SLSDWIPMLLAVILLVSVWIGILNRADSDKDRAIEDALTNHSNTAHSVANYTTQMIERLRFYSRTLAVSELNQATKNLVHSALIQDKAFLRLMHFDEKGQLLFNTG
ncbi:hypothetical protein JZU71_05610, partial [bacterium]|nr:hypothetical protein [bacterium]